MPTTVIARSPAAVSSVSGWPGDRPSAACIDGTSPTVVDIVHFGHRSAGFIQSTPLPADDAYFEVAR